MHEKHAALFTSVNLLLGVGPLILPMPFFDAGIGLSIIWMIIVLLLSYNSAMFINESMGKVRQHDYNLKKEESLISGISEEEDLFSVDEDQVEHKSYDHSEQFAILYG